MKEAKGGAAMRLECNGVQFLRTICRLTHNGAQQYLHRPQGIRLASSPSIYILPKFGSLTPQMSPEDFSQPTSPAQKLELQEVIGSLMYYYARILDHTLLHAVTYLACFQVAPTLDTMAAMERLLGYCAKYPNATQVIRPSPMLLAVFSDASYLFLQNLGLTSPKPPEHVFPHCFHHSHAKFSQLPRGFSTACFFKVAEDSLATTTVI
jgi:hypothetical protein